MGWRFVRVCAVAHDGLHCMRKYNRKDRRAYAARTRRAHNHDV